MDIMNKKKNKLNFQRNIKVVRNLTNLVSSNLHRNNIGRKDKEHKNGPTKKKRF